MGSVLILVEEVIDGIAVCNHKRLISPLITQDIDKETVAGTARHTLIPVISAHHLLHVSLRHESLESRKICLPEIPHRYGSVIRMTQRLRTAMDCIMLGTCMSLVILLVITLHTLDGLHAHYSRKVWILSWSLLSPSPPRVTEDIDIRTPESKFRIAGVISHTHTDSEDIVVGTVPVCARFVRNLREYLIDLLRIERSGHADRLRIDRISILTHTVASLAPPVVGRDSESVDRYGLIHHESDLLLRSKQGKQVLNPLLVGKTRVLEWILVSLASTAGDQDRQYRDANN